MQNELLMRMPAANSFLAHLRPSGEEQLLRDHLLRVYAITLRLAAKAGMPRVVVLIGLANDRGKSFIAFQWYLSRLVGVTT